MKPTMYLRHAWRTDVATPDGEGYHDFGGHLLTQQWYEVDGTEFPPITDRQGEWRDLDIELEPWDRNNNEPPEALRKNPEEWSQ
jgi:hypothetical protein